ncbi:MAG: penicillin-binding transpeptidase domain-containing protein [Gemmatimonadetes bacterium]|nr:penicillin-binding transpeptidase domain-containing protein [Gemmatimonadota bacterium]
MATIRVRLGAIQAALWIGILLVWGRAAQLQLIDGDRHREQARSQRTELVDLPAPRGGIYDRNGVPLALTQEVFHIGIAPNELNDDRNTQAEINRYIEAVATNLALPHRDVTRAVSGSRYAYFHGPFSSAQVRPLAGIPGVHPEGEYSRFHPDADLARSLIGFPESPGRPASGLERSLDTLLQGVSGSAVVLRDRSGRRYESPSRLDAFPIRGSDVYLTIDADLQEIVESALLDALVEYEATSGDVVVMAPATGEILALASLTGDGTAQATVLTNPYEPGSTAKLFVAAALIEHGLVSATDSVWGEDGEYTHAGRTIRDVTKMGWGTLSDVIQLSSNIGIVKFTERLSSSHQYQVLRDFGFGTPSGVEYPSESRGILRRPSEWSGFSRASLAMGYEFAVTPIQLASAYSAIANDGVLLRPTLVRAVRNSAGDLIYQHRPRPVRRVVRSEVAALLREMLVGVVYREGTRSLAALTSYEIAGKTGTSRRVGPNGYIAGAYTASFASIFPASDPQLVTVVKLVDPRGTYGSVTAAPVTRSVIEQALATPTGALDRRRLTRGVSDEVPGEPRSVWEGSVNWYDWPRVTGVQDRDTVALVPQVAGKSMREAASMLHERGLRVVVDGWGRVNGTVPAAGDTVAIGTLVRLRTSGSAPR